jgi:hypothetical protein
VLRLLDGARSAANFVVFDACQQEGLVLVTEPHGMFIAYAGVPGITTHPVAEPEAATR